MPNQPLGPGENLAARQTAVGSPNDGATSKPLSFDDHAEGRNSGPETLLWRQRWSSRWLTGQSRPLDAVAPRRGAAVMLEVLRSEGSRRVFGNPDAPELASMDALTGTPDIGYSWGLQKASEAAMADGYANAAGRPCFVNLHTAGGLGHAAGAVINAQLSNTPLVVTAGKQDMRHNLTDPLPSDDLVRIAAPAMNGAPRSSRPIPVLVRRALDDCTAAPSGIGAPNLIEIPIGIG